MKIQIKPFGTINFVVYHCAYSVISNLPSRADILRAYIQRYLQNLCSKTHVPFVHSPRRYFSRFRLIWLSPKISKKIYILQKYRLRVLGFRTTFAAN